MPSTIGVHMLVQLNSMSDLKRLGINQIELRESKPQIPYACKQSREVGMRL